MPLRVLDGGRKGAVRTVEEMLADSDRLSMREMKRLVAHLREEREAITGKVEQLSLALAVLTRKYGGTTIVESPSGMMLRGDLHLPAPQTCAMPASFRVTVEPTQHGAAVVHVIAEDA